MAAGGLGRQRRWRVSTGTAVVVGVLAAWACVAAAASPPPGAVGSPGAARTRVQVLGAANWSLVLQGQWMVQFYAPWCSACQRLESTWENFAKESELLDLAVGKVDVTEEPGLSGRFFVTTLPTIYHAKDGEFRRYRGSRTSEDLQVYILERKWEAIEPVAGWKSPSSIMMNGMAGLFRLSGWIRQIHSYFTDTLGIHVWGSYAIFILATLLIGLTLGLILVLISDCLCPAKSRYRDETSVEVIEKEHVEQTAGEEQEEAEELSANELEEAEDEKKDLSDGEDGAHSSADGSEEDSAVEEGSGTEEMEDISEQLPADPETQSSVRQRKSQEADSGP